MSELDKSSTHNCPQDITILRAGKLSIGCELCINRNITQGVSAAHDRRTQQQQYRRDLTQPNDAQNFTRAYPNKAKELYDEDTLRRWS